MSRLVYPFSVQIMHWTAMVACVGTVLYAQQTTDKKQKGELMTLHKQMGLLTAGLLAPRVLARLAGPLPQHVHGANTLEQIGAKLSHYVAYGFIFSCP